MMLVKLALALVLMPGVAAVGSDPTLDASDADAPSESTTSDGDEAARPSSRRAYRQWPPTPQSVGIPARAELSPYRGRCTIRKAGKVIDSKIINCSPLRIETTGVVIKKSKINGAVSAGTQDDFSPSVVSDPEGDGPIRVRVIKSEIDASAASNSGFRPISSSHYVVKRSYLHGAYSGGECHNACTIKWSYVEGSGSHASGLRILRNGTLKNNTIWCKPDPNSGDDGGCSGDLTMYEEFGVPHNNLVKHNYFPAGRFWYTLKFNGDDRGRIRIIDNLIGRPRSGGGVADGWDRKASNRWSGNTFPSGRRARP